MALGEPPPPRLPFLFFLLPAGPSLDDPALPFPLKPPFDGLQVQHLPIGNLLPQPLQTCAKRQALPYGHVSELKSLHGDMDEAPPFCDRAFFLGPGLCPLGSAKLES